MNREIEFRAKAKYKEWGTGIEARQWVYGQYFFDVPDDGDDETPAGTILHYINMPHGDHFRAVEIDPETLGQYTGLKDKNGVEIYEGDVLQWQHEWKCDCGNRWNKYRERGYVQWWSGGWYVSAHALGDEMVEPQSLNGWAVERSETTGHCYQVSNGVLRKVVVIGNVFETPELLERGGDV